MSEGSAGSVPKTAAITNGEADASQVASGVSEVPKGHNESQEEDQEVKLESYTPDERKSEIIRVLRWPDWAYYEILQVGEDATEAEIKKAYRKKSLLAHSDKNNDTNAKEVFQRISDANAVLSDKEKRKAYDIDRKEKKETIGLAQGELGEEFEIGAYKEDSEQEEEEDEDDAPMSKEKQAIIDKMGPLVIAALQPGGEEKTKELARLNTKMVEQNQVDKVFVTRHCLPMHLIKNTRMENTRLLQIIQKEIESEKDAKEVRDAEKKLELLKAKVSGEMGNFELPLDWTIDIPPKRQNLGKPKASGGKPNASGGKPNASEGRTSTNKQDDGTRTTAGRRGQDGRVLSNTLQQGHTRATKDSPPSRKIKESDMKRVFSDSPRLFGAPEPPTNSRRQGWTGKKRSNTSDIKSEGNTATASDTDMSGMNTASDMDMSGMNTASDADTDFSEVIPQRQKVKVPGFKTPFYVKPESYTDPDKTTVGWRRHIGIKYINMYGKNKTMARYRIERRPDNEYNDLPDDQNVSNPDNRLGDLKIGTDLKYRHELKVILAVAYPCIGAGPSRDDLKLMDPATSRTRWCETRVLCVWVDRRGEVIGIKWETRSAVRTRWGKTTADEAIYNTARVAEDLYEGKKVPERGLNDDFVRRMHSFPPPAYSSREPTTSARTKHPKGASSHLRDGFDAWREKYIRMAGVESFADFNKEEKLDMMEAWELRQSRLGEAV